MRPVRPPARGFVIRYGRIAGDPDESLCYTWANDDERRSAYVLFHLLLAHKDDLLAAGLDWRSLRVSGSRVST